MSKRNSLHDGFIFTETNVKKGGGEPDAHHDDLRGGRRQRNLCDKRDRVSEVQRRGLPLGLAVHRAEGLRIPGDASRERKTWWGGRGIIAIPRVGVSFVDYILLCSIVIQVTARPDVLTDWLIKTKLCIIFTTFAPAYECRRQQAVQHHGG